MEIFSCIYKVESDSPIHRGDIIYRTYEEMLHCLLREQECSLFCPEGRETPSPQRKQKLSNYRKDLDIFINSDIGEGSSNGSG